MKLSGEQVRQSRERTIAQLRLIWDKRELLIRVFFLGLVFSSIIAFLIPNRYEAVTRLMPPDNQAGIGAAMLSGLATRQGTAPNLGGIASDLLGVKNSGAVFIGILGSRTVQDRLIHQFDLKRVYGNAPMEDLREALANHTGIAEDRRSGIITLVVKDRDPNRAAAIAAAYVSELDRLVAELSTSSARRERIFLEERLGAVKSELDVAAARFSEFASKNTAIDIPAQGKAMVDAAARLQGELIVAESELRGLEAIYTDQNVRVRALRARVSELHTQLEKLGGDAGTAVGEPNSSTMYPSIRKLPVLGVKYAELYRDTKIQEAVFELLTQQYELAKVQEAKEIPSVKVLDVAVVPTKKSFPPRRLIVSLTTVACLVFCCIWLFASEFWKRLDPQEPGKVFLTEIRLTLASDIARFAPIGSTFWRAIRHIGSRNGSGSIDITNQAEVDEDVEIARAAKGGGR